MVITKLSKLGKISHTLIVWWKAWRHERVEASRVGGERYPCSLGYRGTGRYPSKFQILGTAGYRVPRKFQNLGTAVNRIPRKFPKLGTGHRGNFKRWVPSSEETFKVRSFGDLSFWFTQSLVDGSLRRCSVKSAGTKSRFIKLAMGVGCSALLCATGAW